MRTIQRSVFIIVVSTLLATQISRADISKTPTAAKLINEMGMASPRALVPEMMKVYSPLLRAGSKNGVLLTKDLKYGSDERQRLDIHHPGSSSSGYSPVLVYIHGGGFVSGNNRANDEIYGNVGTYFARNGLVVANATYRLAPEHTWPSGAEDIALIIEWLKNNARKYGGDPDQIYLMGHSAGAAHVATYTFFEQFHVADGNDGVRGSILVSGPFDLNTSSNTQYYGEDKSRWPEMSMFNAVAGRKIPVFVIDAEQDVYPIQESTINMISHLCKRDKNCPRYLHVKDHNHISIIFHINTADDSVGHEILDFIHNP